MNSEQKRWRSFIIALLILLFGGFLYAWSVVTLPLEQKYGWSSSSISLAYTLNFLVTALVILFGGKLKSRMGIRRTVLAGGIFTGAGLVLCSMMRGQIWELYLGFSVLYGIGVAFISPALVSYCVQLLPGRSGLAGGASSGAFALGALIWAPAATRILAWKGDVSASFLYLGILMMAPIVVLSFFLTEVSTEPRDEREKEKKPAAQGGLLCMGRGEMLRTGAFYAIVATGVSMAVLILVGSLPLYVAMLVLATLCYGGFACIVGPLTSEVFGPEHFDENYSAIYLVYTIASLIGPVMISAVQEATGALSGAFVAGLGFCAAGALLCAGLLRWAKGKRAKAQRHETTSNT